MAESTEQFLSGGGEMGKLIRNMDWSKTALGPIESWPQSLRTSVSLCLSSTFPILIAWGPETIQIYNDSYRPICGAKHPESMGQNFRICWETALPVVGDAFTRGQHGEGTYITDQRMFLDRYGYLEEAWMTFSFAPIRDESGEVGGIFHPITETTDKMLASRRSQTLRELGMALGKAKSAQDIIHILKESQSRYELDLPFLGIYQLNDDVADLQMMSGISGNEKIMAPSVDVANIESDQWPLHIPVATGENSIVTGLSDIFGEFTAGPYEMVPHTAVILPLRISGQEKLYGFAVAGVSVCRQLDDDYLGFYGLLAAAVNTALSNVFAYEQEQQRAAALAAIDKAKTAFFSNVSHEFRTPLTLMLGPLEDMMSRQTEDSDMKEPLEAAHRNSLRLLKLVNNLLDYSRVEAGRISAKYEPVDITAFTNELASTFESVINKAGMTLDLQLENITGEVYADRSMWEKIVLNLLSNAFKFTLEGTITVKLKEEGHHFIFSVKDSGVGIPAKELPHMFDRFHRVENTRGRTFEGSGIGLSLVSELVQLHGGTIKVESEEGKGSIFTISIPTGKDHLDPELIQPPSEAISTVVREAFIKEASSLIEKDPVKSEVSPSDLPTDEIKEEHPQTYATILVVDDNKDMRDYLARLLEPHFRILTAINGADALEVLKQITPDLILSDIMMPVMDGKELLSRIKNNPEMDQVPVIFLSARAGEEARIDGLEAGADDYLIKPFSANELMSKIRGQIRLSHARMQNENRLRTLFKLAPVALALYRDENHVIEVANERMLDYWGKNSGDVINQPVFDVMPHLIGQGFKQLMDDVFTTGESYVTEEVPVVLERYGRTDHIFMKISMQPIFENGKVVRIVTISYDVTDIVKSRMEAEKYAQGLEDLAARKDEFIGIASHELRSPLTSMKGFLQLLQQMAGSRNIDADLLHFINRAEHQSDKLSTLINDMFDVTKIQGGKIELHLSEFPVGEIFNDILELDRFKKLTHKVTVHGDTRLQVCGDKHRLEQVANNLIENAIKYSPKADRVLINIERENENVKLTITDFGEGIPDAKIPFLFDRFYRVDENSRNISGLGLGLYIAANVIEKHGGTIGVESEVGKGSSFWFTVPGKC